MPDAEQYLVRFFMHRISIRRQQVTWIGPVKYIPDDVAQKLSGMYFDVHWTRTVSFREESAVEGKKKPGSTQ